MGATAAVVGAVGNALAPALVLAALLGVSNRLAGVTVVVATAAAVTVAGSADLGDLAGAQAVLGPAAGWGGLAGAATVTAAAALVVAARRLEGGRVEVAAGAILAGALAAAACAAPGPGGDLWVRGAATVVAAGTAAPLRRWGRGATAGPLLDLLAAAASVAALGLAVGAVA